MPSSTSPDSDNTMTTSASSSSSVAMRRGGSKSGSTASMEIDNSNHGLTEEEIERIPMIDKGTSMIYPLENDLESPDAVQNGPGSSGNVKIVSNGADGLPEKKSTKAFQLLFGIGGIYGAFLYYGSLQEDVFRFKNADGKTFQFAWFLQFLEAFANVIVGFIGRKVAGGVDGLPLRQFMITGASQVSSKAFTSLALAKGLSFPVATLAKSGKMAPVMAGQIIHGGATYRPREYLQVGAIIGGTLLLSLGKKKSGSSQNSLLGILFIILSLVMDGVTGGIQKRLKADMGRLGMHPKPYDFMLYTNLSMMMVAFAVSLVLGDFVKGYTFCSENPVVLELVMKFSVCSAIGQSFIFYTVAHFDPLVCSTVTTTRKIFSVLLSIFFKGHAMSGQGWAGVMIAISGILGEVQDKITGTKNKKGSKK
mmetsp:Transcript_11413/g.16056  ORF Transcript_11413/g.16056 Transcript_11413/m.16056 type:complete len:421 (-) Transcript_11413:23-1285(-)